jgi:large subunit ribosomal protein L18
VDDVNAVTLAASSSILNEMRLQFKSVKKSEQANAVGRQIASVCLKSGIQKVVFDRNGFRYHGRISALADGAREGGLIF